MEQKIYEEVINRGCCKRCVVRYLCKYRDLLTFEYPNTTLVNLGLLPPEQEFEIEPPSKLKKENPCVVCLGVLQDKLFDEILTFPKLKQTVEYNHKTFIAYITFPACVILRDHSMKIHLKRLFPDYYNERVTIKVNHAWRYTIENRLAKILHRKYDGHAKFTVHFCTEYALEEEEMSVTKYFPNYNDCEDYTQQSSRNYLHNALNGMSDDEFCKLIKVPPTISHCEVGLKDMKYFSEALHFTGNYCKYSRDLMQTPFYQKADGTVIVDSVAKIITDAFKSVVGSFGDLIFNASSFDYQAVRVLGNGRTFHLQMNDPKFESISKEQFRRIEKLVKKSKIAAVKNLREADKRDIAVALDAEKMSPRSYKLLVLVYKCKNIDYCVNAVNMYTTLYVQQKCPIRSLHQYRPYWDKKKKIYYIRAKKVASNLLEIDICVQSGLYVQEFVCGEMGRTSPSLSEIMKAKAEVLAIDLIDLQSTLPFAAEESEVVI